MKLAAIDIGSNAVRLLFIHVYETEKGYTYVKDALFRVPLRLGEDVFSEGKLSKKKIEDFVDTMSAFKKLMNVFEPIEYMACATSAMRDASNGKEVLEKIYKKAGLKIQIISGQEEADILFSNHAEKLQFHPKQDYLFIDIGGGSTELILISKGVMIDRKSFNIGTLRLRDNKVDKKQWVSLDSWVNHFKTKHPHLIAVGTGGNINTMQKYFSKSKKMEMPCSVIQDTYTALKDLSVQERILKYSLKPDRADVIVPAAQILLRVTNSLEVQNILVPKVGLADGMIHMLFEKITKKLVLQNNL
ncbi:MAG TPA: hypothetical protein VLZ75_10620 [Chitinophagales bacterium]|nr:hypothetical protein [Chitinophagales bacterium]